MHVSDGIVNAHVLIGGSILAAAGVAAGISRMGVDETPRAAMLAAVLFVASLIHVPFGPSSVHLILNGLAGILLGWMAFPALAVALFLQAMLFQFGGFTVLGVNILAMGLPAVAAHWLFQVCVPSAARKKTKWLFAAGAVLGAAAVCLSGILLTLTLALAGRALMNVALAILAAHVPVMAIDGLVTGAALVFIGMVRPDLLDLARERN